MRNVSFIYTLMLYIICTVIFSKLHSHSPPDERVQGELPWSNDDIHLVLHAKFHVEWSVILDQCDVVDRQANSCNCSNEKNELQLFAFAGLYI